MALNAIQAQETADAIAAVLGGLVDPENPPTAQDVWREICDVLYTKLAAHIATTSTIPGGIYSTGVSPSVVINPAPVPITGTITPG